MFLDNEIDEFVIPKSFYALLPNNSKLSAYMLSYIFIVLMNQNQLYLIEYLKYA